MDTLITDVNILTEEQREAAQTYAGWRNRLYAAVMSDYSVSSIERAERGRDESYEALEALGVDPDSVVVWSKERGTYTVA